MQCLQGANQSHVDYLDYIRRETSRHFGNKNKKYLTAKID